MNVHEFFHEDTYTYTYVVSDPATKKAAIIDSVLDYDAAAGRTSTESVDQLIAYIREQSLEVEWLLETHIHADHLVASLIKYSKTVRALTLESSMHVSFIRQVIRLLVSVT